MLQLSILQISALCQPCGLPTTFQTLNNATQRFLVAQVMIFSQMDDQIKVLIPYLQRAVNLVYVARGDMQASCKSMYSSRKLSGRDMWQSWSRHVLLYLALSQQLSIQPNFQLQLIAFSFNNLLNLKNKKLKHYKHLFS